MIIHLLQIPAEGLHVEGEEEAGFLDLESDEIHVAGPVRYSLDIGLSGGGLFATGSLAVDLHLECVSCLHQFDFPLRVDDFAMQTELSGAETVDLTPYIREDILLALPPYPHCDWNGKRACPGAPRTTAEVSTEAGASTAWEELDKLKLKPRK